MTKTFVVSTKEVDDIDLAVEEILSQLNVGNELLKNSIGIISCHYEFVDSGVVEAVCEALPFETVGTISWLLATPKEMGVFLLTIMVITSDDIEFTTTLTPSLTENPNPIIAESYKTLASERDDSPGLIFVFVPFMPQNVGDEYVDVLTETSGGVPCFGTVAIDDTVDFSNCHSLYNGSHYKDKMVMVLAYGNIAPKFYIANMSEGAVLDKSAIVTKSTGSVIMELNGKTVDEFFADTGLATASDLQYAMTSLPFLFDYGDGTPKVSRNFVGMTPERYAICAGAIPQGSTMQIAPTDKNDVLKTTTRALKEIAKDINDGAGMLMYSCIARNLIMGSEQFGEIKLAEKEIGDKLPYMMMSSGGEICPTQVKDGIATNRFHNNAFVVCLF